MHADLDDLLTALYVLVDDFLPARTGAGRRPMISDAELITLGGRADPAAVPFRAAVPAPGRPAALPPVPLHPSAIGLQQAAAVARAGDLPGHRAPGPPLAVFLRSHPVAGLHAGPVRPTPRDPQALGAGRLGRLRLLSLAFALLLGTAALPALRPGRDAGQLLPGTRERARTRGRRGAAGARPRARTALRRGAHHR